MEKSALYRGYNLRRRLVLCAGCRWGEQSANMPEHLHSGLVGRFKRVHRITTQTHGHHYFPTYYSIKFIKCAAQSGSKFKSSVFALKFDDISTKTTSFSPDSKDSNNAFII